MKTTKLFNLIGLFIAVFFIGQSCKKNSIRTTNPTTPTTPTNPIDTTTPTNPTDPSSSNFMVDNRWQCQIDGVNYSGTVDTSFLIIRNPGEINADTVITITGTADDKKANIKFIITINRYLYPGPLSSTTGKSLMFFDTISPRFLTGQGYNNGSDLIYNINRFNGFKIKSTFSGKLWLPPDVGLSGGSIHNVSNGSLNFELGLGNNEPKKFKFNSANSVVAGNFSSAILASNTLIMEGMTYPDYDEQKFKLQILTGSTVKPGIYKSSDGNVGLQKGTASYYSYYVNSLGGELTAIIKTVNGEIVTGSFSGTNYLGQEITAGSFSCRIKNYYPVADALNTWSFGTSGSILGYSLYGGNIINANKSDSAGRYFLTLNGDTDNGNSNFKLVLSSNNPFAAGIYTISNPPSLLNEFYFDCIRKLWNGNRIYITKNSSIYPIFCRIDSIDVQKVSGIIYGGASLITTNYSSEQLQILNGKFNASF